MKNNVYRVEFVTKKGGDKSWAIDIEEDSQKVAKEVAKSMWYKNHDVHAFTLTARKLKPDKEQLYNGFVRTDA